METSQRWVMHDRYGNLVYMTGERWHHALEKRPWLSGFLEEVFNAVRQGRRQQDPLNPKKYKYYCPCRQLNPEYNHIVVVVLFGQKTDEIGQSVANNYVVNVWAVYIYRDR
jgi:hypothetical protein